MAKMIGSRIRFSIWFVLGIAVCVTFASLFQTNPKAQDISPQTTEEKTQPSDELDRSFSTLLDIAREKDAVRVIIGLRLDGFRPVGELGDLQREKQQADIKTAQNDTLKRLESYNLTGVKQFEYMPYLAAEVDTAALEIMRQDLQIVSIQEDEAVAPSLAESVSVVSAPAAWAAGFTGSGWAVAVLDTGVDKSHSFLSGKVTSEACYSTNSPASNATSVCPGGVAQSTASNSGVHCSASISGCNHGTHVAGIAAGTNASFSGVARNANVIAIQVFTRFGNQSDCGTATAPCALSYQSDQILGLERVLALSSSTNIAAVNMSLGGGQFTSNCDTQPQKPAIDNLRSVGIATIISSGNDGYTNSMGAPGCISTAVSVGSTGDGSGGSTVNAVSSFSNSASFLNLLAPGQLINSSVPGGTFSNLQGTSMAAPHVAGAWAVLKQKKPTATVTEILNAFNSTGVAITDTRNGIVKPRIKVDSALAAITTSCGAAPMSIGQTLSGNLQSGDCLFTDNSYYDAYTFSGTAGQQIAISMNSTQFNAYLFLYQGNYPGGSVVAQDNNGGGGTNARIPATSGFLTLPATATYTILANSFAVGETGAYSLNLSGNVVPPGTSRPADFDGDNKTDLSIFRPASGQWWINRSSNSSTFAAQFGASGDRIVPADYTGDAKTDIAVWRPSNGNWIILRSEDFSFFAFPYGASGDIPAPGDFDADGRADAVVFRPSQSTWYIRRSSDGGSTIQQFGTAGDVPVTADFDGDGRADIAIYRPSLGQWWIARSAAGTVAYQFGNSGDRTVQGDYTGDGKADVAFWRPSTGTWFVLRSENSTFFAFPYGDSADIPSPGDYDGDGRYDGGVFRPSTSTWYVNRSSNGTSLIQQFGAIGDLSVPNAYVR